jgi:hypothetical protein
VFENQMYIAERGVKNLKSVAVEMDDRKMISLRRIVEVRIKALTDSLEKMEEKREAIENELTELRAAGFEIDRFEQLAFPEVASKKSA